MTRLTTDDIHDIPGRLAAYDGTLQGMTGTDLGGLGCRAFGLHQSVFREAAACTRVGVVPVAWGQGIIAGFSETVMAIAEHLGFNAFVTTERNVAGLAEAVEKRADVILLSDDDDFRAIHLEAGVSVDNSSATGKVFAVGLDLMAGGLTGKKALVIGCGPVGQQAGCALLQLGATLCLVDADPEKACRTAQLLKRLTKRGADVGHDLQQALLQHRFIVDATPAAGIIDAAHITGGSMIAAPGVPLGLTSRAARKTAGRLLHDTLQLGVAAMLAGVVKQARAPTVFISD